MIYAADPLQCKNNIFFAKSDYGLIKGHEKYLTPSYACPFTAGRPAEAILRSLFCSEIFTRRAMYPTA